MIAKLGIVFTTWRGWSWVFGMLSMLPILFGVYHYWQFSVWASEQSKNGQFICGTGIVVVFAFCLIASTFFAVCAIVCAIVARMRKKSSH